MRTEVEARGGDQKYQDCCAESDHEAPGRVQITRDEKGEETVEHDVDRAMAAREGKCTPGRSREARRGELDAAPL